MRHVYLDNNATTCVAPEVLEAMMPFFTELWGNPSSMHSFGGRVKKHIETARAQVAALIGADPSEIVFTGCGTESNNTAIRGAAEAASAPGTPVPLITSRVEHLSVLEPCRSLATAGHPLTELEVDGDGRLDMERLHREFSKSRGLASLMWANNETGVLFPIKEIAETAKNFGWIFHTDAVQAVGKIPVDMRTVPVDLLSFSGHKLHAPKGIGALYIRKGVRLKPLLLGGHQEGGKRAGTENVPYIVGLGKACELAARHIEEENRRVKALRDRLQQGILEKCPDVTVNGGNAERLPNTLNVSFKYVEGEAILYLLSDAGISASSGSACTSGSLEPSHVIRAMGVPFMLAHGSIRFSFSRYNTEEDVDYVLEKLPGIIAKLRAISPFGR